MSRWTVFPHRHGVARVNGQIQDDLFDVPGVGDHKRKVWREVKGELDLFADGPMKDFFNVSNGVVETQRPRLNDFSAGERQELVRQDTGAFCGDLDLRDVLEGSLPTNA